MTTKAPEIETTTYAVEQRKKLRRVLGRGDLILYSVSAVIGVDTIASSAGLGGFPFITWTVLSAILFLLPYGLITAELASTFPREGGLFVWTKEAYGPYIGSVVSFVYWISNPIWMGSLALSAVGILEAAFGWHLSTGGGLILALVFVWLATFLEIFYLNTAKWLPNLGGLLKFLLLVLLFVGALVVVAHKGSANPVSLSAFVPSGSLTLTLMGVLIFNWVGFEVQSCAAEEMKDPRRDVPRSILVSGLMGAIGYSVGILAVMLITPSSKISNVTGLFAAYQGAFHASAFLGIVALAIVIGYLSSGTAWLIGVDRSFAASAWDRSIPRWFGHFHSEFGTPDRVAIVSGVMGSVALLLNYVSNHSLSFSGIYSSILNAAFVAALFPYLFMLPSVLILRRKYPDLKRPYQVPGGTFGVWLSVILSSLFVLFGLLASFIPNRYSGTSTQTAVFQLEALIGEIVVATILYLLAQREPADKAKISLTEVEATD